MDEALNHTSRRSSAGFFFNRSSMSILNEIVQKIIEDMSVPSVMHNATHFVINEVITVTCTGQWHEPIIVGTVRVGGASHAQPSTTATLHKDIEAVCDWFIAECERDYDRISAAMRPRFDEKRQRAQEVKSAALKVSRFCELLEQCKLIICSWVGLEKPRVRLMGPSFDDMALVIVDDGVHIDTVYLQGAKPNLGAIEELNEMLKLSWVRS